MTSQNNKKTSKIKPVKPNISARRSVLHKGIIPNPQETNTLVTLFTAGRYTEAASLAQAMTLRFPQHVFGWKMLGVILKRMGRGADALAPMQQATLLLPNDAEAHSNLGITLQGMGRLDEAAASYRRALQIKPDYVDVLNNLGNTLKNMGLLDEAESSYRRALQIKPDYAEANSNLGVTLQDMGRLDEAETSYRRALSLKPDYANAYCHLGTVLKVQDRLDEALACFQQLLRLIPESGAAQHHIASLTGSNTEHAPIQYIENLFDGYADKFDTHLQQRLKYETPEKLVALVTQHLTQPVEKWNVLDLGCGTGLVGSAIASFARQLVGVDLSAKMLEKAKARNLYQRLEHLELLAMMRGEKASIYDVIIAADVFIYIGKLDEIIGEIKRLLCPSGMVAFSIETLEASSGEETSQDDQQEYRLEKTGRYAQSINYITRLASANGFLIKAMVATPIRVEGGKPVNGHLVLLRN